jgi:hypothetical protein
MSQKGQGWVKGFALAFLTDAFKSTNHEGHEGRQRKAKNIGSLVA